MDAARQALKKLAALPETSSAQRGDALVALDGWLSQALCFLLTSALGPPDLSVFVCSEDKHHSNAHG